MDNMEGSQTKPVLSNGETDTLRELQIQVDDEGSISDTSVTQLTSSDCNSFVNAQIKQYNTLTSLTSSTDTSQSSETESDSQIAREKILSSATSTSADSSISSSSGSQSEECCGNKNRKHDDDGKKSSLDPKDWYLHPRFNFYWQHYNHAMSWLQKHKSVTKYLRQKYSRKYNYPYAYPMPFYPYGGSTSHNFHGNLGHGRGANFHTMYNFGHPGRGRGRSVNSDSQVSEHVISSEETDASFTAKDDSTSTEDTNASYSESEQFEMEITDEMLQFFAHSQRHRKERDERKLGPNGKEEQHIDVDLIKVNRKAPTTEAPKERPGSNRTAEMTLLYGKGAAMIHGMETALQMTFDRNLDIKQPKIWPNMPLKLVFT